jgi:hypothetical protein
VQRVPGFFEVDQDERASPGMAFWLTPTGDQGRHVDSELACYRAAFNLVRETEMAMPALLFNREEAARQVLAKPRECNRWGEYQPGLDPHGHLMELKFIELEESRKNFQLQMAKMRADSEQPDRHKPPYVTPNDPMGGLGDTVRAPLPKAGPRHFLPAHRECLHGVTFL